MTTQDNRWQPIETAPKNQTDILFGGRFLPFDCHSGGEWTQIIVRWSTLDSNLTTAVWQWLGPSLDSPERYNVDWTHWATLPSPPEDTE